MAMTPELQELLKSKTPPDSYSVCSGSCPILIFFLQWDVSTSLFLLLEVMYDEWLIDLAFCTLAVATMKSCYKLFAHLKCSKINC